MTLHIFNPEHDIALASGLWNFTAPHAARLLRHDLAFLPAIWAKADDAVLVEDAEAAARSLRRLRLPITGIALVTRSQLPQLTISSIEPWGWNAALRALLLRCGIDRQLLPSPEAIEQMRQLSRRSLACRLLPKLRMEGTVGESVECNSMDDVARLLRHYGHIVVKAPWSSSGRGIRYIDSEEAFSRHELQGWMSRVMESQQSVMVEPYYNKVKDLAMEFHADAHGNISYEGLSLFHTENGAYTGNLLATEQACLSIITRYISADLLERIKQTIQNELRDALSNKYIGSVGVDMMIVSIHNSPKPRFMLHPCVEINLRRTMGHVALATELRLNPTHDDELQHAMRIQYANDNYQLRLTRL